MNWPVDSSKPRADLERQALADDIADVALGSSSAMSRIYAATSPKLNALLLRMLGDPGEAEDVLQEVYLTVWRRGASFDPARASPITWLVTIARNRAIDRIRTQKTHPGRISEKVDASAVPDPARSVIELIEETENKQRLLECFEELEDRHQKSIRAAFFDGLTYEDLAVREGVPVGTMKSWIRRGLLRLRGCMDR
jgi:RNA polymerase sigma factor (sigma-70 family)